MDTKRLTAVLDRTLQRITKETGLVGGAIAITKGEEVVYTYNYGYADREKKIPSSQDTLYDVASTSKAWTVMLAAQAIDEGLLDWDTPIKNYIPWFEMMDEYAGNNLSVRDMASHRSGLPSHDFMREKILGDRENLTRKLKYLDPNAGFRSKYQYNNHMFILLGYLEEVIRGGESWENQIHERIAKRLGISPIFTRGTNPDLTGIEVATPYCSNGFEAGICAHADNFSSSPCGGIRISMKNMAKWIIAMSRGGRTPDGGRLCSEKQFQEIIAPVIGTGQNYGFLKSIAYAKAWHVTEYYGKTLLFHGGGHAGFNTQVGFLKDEEVGYVMCFNTGTTPAAGIACAIVLDAIVKGDVEDSYDRMIDKWLKDRDEMAAQVKSNAEGTPVTVESDPDLMGVYAHPAYEEFVIDEAEGQLRFTYGNFTAKIRREADGSISAYSGGYDGLTPDHVKLKVEENGDLQLYTSDTKFWLSFKKKA